MRLHLKHSLNFFICLFSIRQTKMDATPAAAAAGIKPTTGATTTPQPTKIATPPLTGIGKSQFHHY